MDHVPTFCFWCDRNPTFYMTEQIKQTENILDFIDMAYSSSNFFLNYKENLIVYAKPE